MHATPRLRHRSGFIPHRQAQATLTNRNHNRRDSSKCRYLPAAMINNPPSPPIVGAPICAAWASNLPRPREAQHESPLPQQQVPLSFYRQAERHRDTTSMWCRNTTHQKLHPHLPQVSAQQGWQRHPPPMCYYSQPTIFANRYYSTLSNAYSDPQPFVKFPVFPPGPGSAPNPQDPPGKPAQSYSQREVQGLYSQQHQQGYDEPQLSYYPRTHSHSHQLSGSLGGVGVLLMQTMASRCMHTSRSRLFGDQRVARDSVQAAHPRWRC
jgi:hypothetical protein